VPAPADVLEQASEPIASQVRDDLDADTLAKLERLRRGLDP
jgi:hypothetical protein